MSYVVSRLLPQVTAHLPADRVAVGAIRLDGITLPLVCEPIVSADWRSARHFYVVYAGGEPTCYYSPAAFRRLVRQHRAVVVAGSHTTVGSSTVGSPTSIRRREVTA